MCMTLFAPFCDIFFVKKKTHPMLISLILYRLIESLKTHTHVYISIYIVDVPRRQNQVNAESALIRTDNIIMEPYWKSERMFVGTGCKKKEELTDGHGYGIQAKSNKQSG